MAIKTSLKLCRWCVFQMSNFSDYTHVYMCIYILYYVSFEFDFSTSSHAETISASLYLFHICDMRTILQGISYVSCFKQLSMQIQELKLLKSRGKNPRKKLQHFVAKMQWICLQEARRENLQHKTMNKCSTTSYYVHAKVKTWYINFVLTTLISSSGTWTSLSSTGLNKK